MPIASAFLIRDRPTPRHKPHSSGSRHNPRCRSDLEHGNYRRGLREARQIGNRPSAKSIPGLGRTVTKFVVRGMQFETQLRFVAYLRLNVNFHRS